jgi:hypothetical protein
MKPRMPVWGTSARALLFVCVFAGLSALARPARAVPAPAQTPGCGSGWVYFDLGDTLIDTRDWNHLKYLPQALDYLHALKRAGFRLGMITNVPQSWGATHDEKLARLKQDIASTWAEATPFEWDAFDSILLPPTEADRKPAPYLFDEARADQRDCRIAYEGEDPAEISAALKSRFDWGYVVGSQAPRGFYPPADGIFKGVRPAGR